MVSRAYNGFPPEYRNKRGRLVYKMFESGRLKRPQSCCMCQRTAQSGATIHAHTEDYHSQTAYVGLCVMCHFAVHRRFAHLTDWHHWRNAVASGWQPPKTRDYRIFRQIFDNFRVQPLGPVDPTNWAFTLADKEPDLYNRDVEVEDLTKPAGLF
jgi:hypothetical protein